MVLSYWYAIVHCDRGGTLDGVHNGEELAAVKYVATGKNSATGDWIECIGEFRVFSVHLMLFHNKNFRIEIEHNLCIKSK